MIEILKRGENTSLCKFVKNLNDIIVAIKWVKKENETAEFDIDSSAFQLTVDNKVRNDADFIFYNQPNSIDNAIVLKNSMFKIVLNTISPDIEKISFVLTLHGAKQKQQNFGMLEKIIIGIFNGSDKQQLFFYSLEDANAETAIILGQLYRHNNEWKFKAIGQGYTDGLAVLARNFGVDVDETPESQTQNQINNDIDTPPVKNDEGKAQTKNKSNLPNSEKTQQPNLKNKELKSQEVDIHNTDIMTKEAHYEPIVQWFKQKKFVAEVNPNAMDTSGFFDEVAVELGDDYELLKIVSNTIKRRQVDKRTAYIHLENYNSQQKESIKKFCKQLYSYSFVAKYFYNQNENEIVLHLQAAVKIVNFFNGDWLEWYAFMKIAKFCHQRKINFSCTRNLIINLPDKSKYELDVFCLIDGMPLFIECKSGEYRGFIDKYSRLKNKMSIAKPYFWFLISGASDEQVKGLTAMFDITFINEKMLDDYCEDVFVKKKLNNPTKAKNSNSEALSFKDKYNKSLEIKPLQTKIHNRRPRKHNTFKPANIRETHNKSGIVGKLFFLLGVFLLISLLSYYK